MKLRGHLRPDAKAVSLIKGMSVEDGEPQLISERINGKSWPFCNISPSPARWK
jgi:hypothetical protein